MPVKPSLATNAPTPVNKAIAAATIDCDECVDARTAVTEQMLHAAQVAEAFLADIADKQDIRIGHDVVLLECTQDSEHDDEATSVVADSGRKIRVALNAYGHVGFDGEYGVEVCRDCNDMAATPGTTSNDVAFRVRRYITEARCPQHLRKSRTALLLTEWRGRDLIKLDHVGDQP